MRRKRGISLAITLMTLVILTVIATAIGALGVSNLGQIRESSRKAAILHGANGGLNELMDLMYQDLTYGGSPGSSSVTGEGTYNSSIGTIYYWWSFNPGTGKGQSVNNLTTAVPTVNAGGIRVPPLTALLIVNADTVPRRDSTRPMRVAAIGSKSFRMAVAVDGTANVREINAATGYPGGIWSNADEQRTVSATSVDGLVFSGGGSGSVSVSSLPTGVHHFDADRLQLPDIPVQDVIESADPRSSDHPYAQPATYAAYSTGGSNAVLTLQTDNNGVWRIAGMQNVQGNVLYKSDGTTLGIGGSINPPATGQPHLSLFVDGDLRFNGGATIAPRMHLFVEDDFDVSGSLSQLPTSGTQDNFFFVGDDIGYSGSNGSNINMLAGGDIVQNGSSNYKGLFYTREGSFRITGGGTVSNFEGVTVIRKGDSGSGNLDAASANFKYNPAYLEALKRYNVSVNEETPVYAISWWIEE